MTAAQFRRRFRPQLECLEGRSVPRATTTALTASLNPATPGQAITFTATVTGGAFPAGSKFGDPYSLESGTNDVTFFDAATPLLTVTPTPTGGPNNESRAQFTTSNLGLGTHAVTARYNSARYLNFLSNNSIIDDASTSSALIEGINAPPPSIAADVSGAVSVTAVPMPRRRNSAVRLVKLHNAGGTTVEGPLYLVLHGLKRKVRLKGASGLTQQHGPPGDPFVLLNVRLLPGGEHAVFLRFSNPKHKTIRFTAQVLAGPGTV